MVSKLSAPCIMEIDSKAPESLPVMSHEVEVVLERETILNVPP